MKYISCTNVKKIVVRRDDINRNGIIDLYLYRVYGNEGVLLVIYCVVELIDSIRVRGYM